MLKENAESYLVECVIHILCNQTISRVFFLPKISRNSQFDRITVIPCIGFVFILAVFWINRISSDSLFCAISEVSLSVCGYCVYFSVSIVCVFIFVEKRLKKQQYQSESLARDYCKSKRLLI